MTVKEAVLLAIIKNYPKVKNHVIHNASPEHLFSATQRLRELRKLGVRYSFDTKTNTYDFSETPIKYFKGLLKETEKTNNTYTRVIKNFTETLF